MMRLNLAKPLMDIMGQKILHAGPQGSGVGVKICNNMSLGISMIAASEALMLAKRLKMDLKKVHEIMKNASGNNWALYYIYAVTRILQRAFLQTTNIDQVFRQQ